MARFPPEYTELHTGGISARNCSKESVDSSKYSIPPSIGGSIVWTTFRSPLNSQCAPFPSQRCDRGSVICSLPRASAESYADSASSALIKYWSIQTKRESPWLPVSWTSTSTRSHTYHPLASLGWAEGLNMLSWSFFLTYSSSVSGGSSSSAQVSSPLGEGSGSIVIRSSDSPSNLHLLPLSVASLSTAASARLTALT